MQSVVHEYFKKEFEGFKVLVQVNPIDYRGVELTIQDDGAIEKRKLEFDEEIFDDLAVDEFDSCSPLEFNLYLKGLVDND